MLDLYKGILEIFAEAQHPPSLKAVEAKKSWFRLIRWDQNARSNKKQKESIATLTSKFLRMKTALKLRTWIAPSPTRSPRRFFPSTSALPLQPATHTEPRTPLFRMTRREHDQLIVKRRQNLSRVR